MDIPQVQKFFELVVNPIITLLFAAAVFYFAFGVFTYIRESGDPDGRAQGGRHILWSTVGIFIMISVWGIIALIRNTLGIS
jgi:hypothetical protein